ncbi:MAG TPA: DUF455 family protein [Planctomycetota bacterium]
MRQFPDKLPDNPHADPSWHHGRALDTPLTPQPPPGTVEAWCLELVTTTDLEGKLRPAPPPDRWEPAPPARRLAAPGRPAGLSRTARAPRTPRPEALVDPRARARLVHAFLHHELQAAELFAWAILAFPAAPREFRAGCLRLAREELAHLALYRAHLAHLGATCGDFPVRDWFWERVGGVRDELAFVAWLGLGLEGANLEHSARFAAAFRAAGDEEGARILERVEHDEVGHVAFARAWFEHWSGAPLDYERWRAVLPRPLTPAVLRGLPLNRTARARAGLDAAFLARLEAEPATTTRSPR